MRTDIVLQRQLSSLYILKNPMQSTVEGEGERKKEEAVQPSRHYILMWMLHILSRMSTAAMDICEVFV